jgi:aryl-alcohol dehydrogenase-like predicted oxidoreductase
MRYVEAGGTRISVVGLGTWQFGSREWGYGNEYSASEAARILRRAVELGVNLVDTAEIYGFGRSERIIGEVLSVGDGSRSDGAASTLRDKVFLATKVFPIAAVSPIVVQRARASLARLRTDRIDLYQIHWKNPLLPLQTTMEGMRKLLDEGAVLHAGVSNFSLAKWREAESLLGSPVLTNQVRYNLVDRRPERELISWAQKEGRVVIAYSPLAQGFLSARYSPDNRPKGMARQSNPLFLPENLERAATLFEVLRRVAEAHDATPSQVALAWILRRPNVVVIPGAASVEQLERNVAAADLEITDDEDAALTEASDAFRPITGPASIPKVLRARLGR